MNGPHGGRANPIERFLGPDALGGPANLLALGDGPVTEARVIRSLERRLAEIDDHAHGMTPEADEVRLALHAAAAQELDRIARARPREAARARGRPAISGGRTLAMQLEQDAVLTLARYGGWNKRALRRLTMVALARGAKPDDLAGVLSRMARMPGARRRRHRPAGGAGAASGATGPMVEPRATAMPSPDAAGPEGSGRPLAILIGAMATVLVLVVTVALVLVAVTSSGPEKSETPVAGPDEGAAPPVPRDLPMARGEEMFPWQGDGVAPGQAETEPDAPAFSGLADAIVGLDTCVAGLEVDPREAVRVFDQALRAIGAEWCHLTPSQRRAAQHDVVEFVYRAVQRPQNAEAVVRAVSRGAAPLADAGVAASPGQVWPVTWSVGLLARLAREQDLGATAGRLVDEELKRLVGSAVVVSGGFEQGVRGGLWAMLPGMLSVTPASAAEEAWGNWVEAATATGDRDRSVLAALEWVLVGAEEPTESEPVRWAVEHLVRASDWGADSPTQAWLVRMFDDQRVTVADLHALTTTLTRRSSAPAVDVTMTLALRSSDSARAALRERYATAWGVSLQGPSLDDLAADWLKAAREAVRGIEADPTFVVGIARAAVLSRLSEAAALRHAGRLDEAGIVIDEYDRPVELELAQVSQRRSGDRVPGSPGMSRWALTYLSAQKDFPERMRLLGEAAGMQIHETVDAEVLVTEAVRGSPAQAREAARNALLAQRPSAVLTLAMLEVAPVMPRTVQNAELVATVSGSLRISIDDPDWRLNTRRVLVQAALEQLAAEGDHGAIDALARRLSASYVARANADAAAVSEAPPAAAPSAAAAGLRVQWERRARTSGLGAGVVQIDAALARHAARQRLAQGPVQAFAAEQLASFDLMSIAVGTERLDRSADVAAVRERVQLERSGADDVIQQIIAIERGFIDLWAIRLGQELP